MTIAITLKVNDGVVLAADSATTIVDGDGGVGNVYNNANKIANLRKGLPIGAVTWGAGNLGHASISTLYKDLRARLTDRSAMPDEPEWHVDPENYTIEHVAELVKRFMIDGLYKEVFGFTEGSPPFGIWVAGYSSAGQLAEEYEIGVRNGEPYGPNLIRPLGEIGIGWQGEPEALVRLMLGYGRDLPRVLRENLGVPDDQIKEAMRVIRQSLQVQLIHPAMPIQDAIDLARCLAELACDFSRFKFGAPTVGGPVEVAAITKHEGFKWVSRKHYYRPELNPEAT